MNPGKELKQYITGKHGTIDVIIDLFSMELVWVSDEFAETLGFKPDELIDKHVNEVLILDRKLLVKEVSKILGKKSMDDTKVLRKKSGEKIRIDGRLYHLMYKLEPYLAIKIIKYYKTL